VNTISLSSDFTIDTETMLKNLVSILSNLDRLHIVITTMSS
jgi:hypothetical protein